MHFHCKVFRRLAFSRSHLLDSRLKNESLENPKGSLIVTAHVSLKRT